MGGACIRTRNAEFGGYWVGTVNVAGKVGGADILDGVIASGFPDGSGAVIDVLLVGGG